MTKNFGSKGKYFRDGFYQRSVPELVEELKALTIEIQELYYQDRLPWIVGYSGGKDSTAVLQLVWSAIAALPPHQRTKAVHVISTDTRVENPIISTWVHQSLNRMAIAAQQKDLPFHPHPLQPEVQDSFWVKLLGKGYPAPRQKFRWCTERLKIHPANCFIRDVVRASGETILVLGTRKAESQKRAATMAKHAEKRVRDRLSPNASLPNSLIYSPIEDWKNDEVWLYLMQWQNPWGHSNKDLFSIYRGATADNECPLVIDTSTPSCGSSRFGCWVCTLVDRDKSMEAMILNDDSKDWMQPLLDFRGELDFRSDEKHDQERQNRDFRRLSGNVHLFGYDVNNSEKEKKKVVNNSEKKEQEKDLHVPGPYIKTWREYLLRRLLETQAIVRAKAPVEMKTIELISLAELSEIRRIWLEEKHEFDDALPQIYEAVTGKPFNDLRSNGDRSFLGMDEWSILEEICDDPMHFELMTRLLSTERKFQTMSRRIGIIDALEKHFDTSSRVKKEAIENAELDWNIKKAAKAGDVETVKQLTVDAAAPEKQSAPSWADLKFKGRQ